MVRRVPLLMIALTLLLVPAGPAGSVAPTTGLGVAVGADTAARVYPGGATDGFSPKGGIHFNNPVGTKSSQRAILTRILRSIDSTPRWATIQIMSFNIVSAEGVRKLIAAHERGVRVRVITYEARTRNNPDWARLRTALSQNAGRAPERRSLAQTCSGSCRGPKGAPHSKYYMFSRAGDSKMVVMQGSANLTATSTHSQWNDMQTWTGGQQLWDFYDMIFRQMELDVTQSPTYRSLKVGRQTVAFSPLGTKQDPFLALANTVRCTGATNTESGRTVIRYFPDVMRNEAGMRLAERLKTLWNQGCDIKIGWTVLGDPVYDVLRSRSGRGPVPMRHLALHRDDDGAYDLYSHLKSISVRGHVGSNPAASRVINGSANVSALSSISDENYGMSSQEWVAKRYQSWMSHVYTHAPVGRRLDLSGGRFASVDPYANMREDDLF